MAIFWNLFGLCHLKHPVGFGSDEVLLLEELRKENESVEGFFGFFLNHFIGIGWARSGWSFGSLI